MEKARELAAVSEATVLDWLTLGVQTVFYGTIGTVAVLTYRSAKRTLLNNVNSEYHKREFTKLEVLSARLYDELDPQSENYWGKEWDFVNTIKELVLAKQAELEGKKLTESQFELLDGGTPVSKVEQELKRFKDEVQSEPFVPDEIRILIVEHLENRQQVLMSGRMKVIQKYGKITPEEVSSLNAKNLAFAASNELNNYLYENSAGIGQVQEQVHNIRNAIQLYLKRFDPFKS